MLIRIDYQDKRPIYEQIVEKMQNLIVRGVLADNDKIPSVRNLAIELSINPNTIQKAYQELERKGYIYTVKGRGNFVSSPNDWKDERRDGFFSELKKSVAELKAIGVAKEDILLAVEKEYDK